MKQQLIITKGLPASGKSTWAKAWVLEDPKHRVRVNRDDIRRMLGPYWVPSREELVTDIEVKCVLFALQREYSVVVDATNFRDGYWLNLHRNYKPGELELVLQDFTDVSLETCIERDSKRGEESVGEEVIRGMYNKYLKK